jgi:hypothetical protein
VLIILKRYTPRLLLTYSVTFGVALFVATKFPLISLNYLASAAVIPVAGVFLLLCLSEVQRNNITLRTKLLLTALVSVLIVVGFIALWQLGFMERIAGKFITVNDKDTISLGNRTLEFIHAPWVHWPETMLTYLREDKILFPCDLFGSHLATNEGFVTDKGQVYEAAKRYFAEIMMPFRPNIQKHLERLKGYKIDIIAPSHGPMHNRPEFILKAYRSWVFDEPKNIVPGCLSSQVNRD